MEKKLISVGKAFFMPSSKVKRLKRGYYRKNKQFSEKDCETCKNLTASGLVCTATRVIKKGKCILRVPIDGAEEIDEFEVATPTQDK